MVNEQNRYEGQEEGEYHFSDDQMGYETEEDLTVKPDTRPNPSANMLLAGPRNPKRLLVGGAVFFSLIYIVYKILVPSTPTPTTEINQTAAKPMVAQPATTAAVHATSVTPTPVAPPVPSTGGPVSTTTTGAVVPPPPSSGSPPVVGSEEAKLLQASSSPSIVSPPPSPVAAPAPLAQPGPTILPPKTGTTESSTVMVNSVPVTEANKPIMDRLLSLEDQNTKLAYAIQTEYAKKLSSYEQQNQALQSKVQELNTRIASMEASLNQLTQILQSGNEWSKAQPSAGSVVTPPPPPPSVVMRVPEPKATYTVQAIIPGRAWLKSDMNGETVTVAEGEILKNYGRVIKIDPYDGTVNVDIGNNKVVTLTYGGSSE